MDRAVRIHVIRCSRVKDGACDGRKRRLVKDHLTTRDCDGHGTWIANIALDEADIVPNSRKPLRRPGGEVVKHDDLVPVRQKGRHEVMANKTASARDQRLHRPPGSATVARSQVRHHNSNISNVHKRCAWPPVL